MGLFSTRKGKISIVAAALVLATTCWYFCKGKLVDPDGLDYLQVRRAGPSELVLIGAWEPPMGPTLNAARHRLVDGKLVLWLYSKAFVNTRGQRGRAFNVHIHLDHPVPDEVLVEGCRNGRKLLRVEGPLKSPSFGAVVNSKHW